MIINDNRASKTKITNVKKKARMIVSEWQDGQFQHKTGIYKKEQKCILGLRNMHVKLKIYYMYLHIFENVEMSLVNSNSGQSDYPNCLIDK